MYVTRNELWSGAHNSAAVTAPALNWFLAEGATGSFFDTFVLVANPNTSPADSARHLHAARWETSSATTRSSASSV